MGDEEWKWSDTPTSLARALQLGLLTYTGRQHAPQRLCQPRRRSPYANTLGNLASLEFNRDGSVDRAGQMNGRGGQGRVGSGTKERVQRLVSSPVRAFPPPF